MANQFNSFPLILKYQLDTGSASIIQNAEKFLTSTASRAGQAWEKAGKTASGAFNFDSARREIQQISREIDAFRNKQARRGVDLLGVQDSLAALGNNPFQRVIQEQLSAENALSAQRERMQAQRIAGIEREFNAAMSAIRAEQSARTEAFKQAESEGLRLIALDKQRIAESAKLVAGPQFIQSVAFDPAGAQAAAQAARAFAQQQIALADAAERSALSMAKATAADRAFAVSAREAANAATAEANRLEAVAATQQRVAASAAAAGTKLAASGDIVTGSLRGQRFATIQASQQFQDLFIQIQGGQNPLIAFSQQASQLAFVMAGAGGEAGKFARFMAGGWGSLIFAGIAVLSIFTSKLFENSDASKAAKNSNIDFTNALEVSRAFVENHSKAIEGLSNATRGLINTQAILIDSLRNVAQASVAGLNAQLATIDSKIAALSKSNVALPGFDNNLEIAGLQKQRAQIIKDLASTEASFAEAQTAFEARRAAESVDSNLKARREIEREQALLQQLRQKTIDQGAVPLADFVGISGEEFERQYAELEKRKKALDEVGKSASSRIRTLNAQARLAAADDPTEQARAQLQLTKAVNAELLRQGKISEDTYRSRVQASEIEVQRAQGLKRAASESAKAAREYQRLLDFGDRSAESIQRINEQFDDQPRLIDSAARATRTLDDIIAELALRQPPGFEKMIADAEAAKGIVESGLLKPFRDFVKEAKENAAIQELVLAGREDEADALAEILRLEEQMGPLTAEQRNIVRDIVNAEYERGKQIERNNALIDIQVQAARRLQDAFTDLLDGGSFKNFSKSIAQIQRRAVAEQLSIQLLGDLGGDVRDALTRQSGPLAVAAESLKRSGQASGDALRTAADRHIDAAGALLDAAGALSRSAANDNPSLSQLSTTPSAFGNFSGLAPDGSIVVTGNPGSLAAQIAGGAINVPVPDINAAFGGEFAGLSKLFGGSIGSNPLSGFATKFSTPLALLSGVVGGQAGGAIDSLLALPGFDEIGKKIAAQIGGKLDSAVGGALAGAGTGLFVDSVFKAIGLKGSSTGGAVGGAIGGAIGSIIPGVGTFLGGLIGGALGSVVGGLFKKTAKVYTTVGTDASGNVSTVVSESQGKNERGRRLANEDNAIALIDSLQEIARSFGGSLATNFQIGNIGSKEKKFLFDPTPGTKADAQFFDTQEEAIKAAIMSAIDRGIIQGIRESTKRLIAAGGDLEKQLEKAVTFENVFKELKSYTDPVGAAIDELNGQFNELRQIFAEAGATAEEYAQLEQLYQFKKAEAIEQFSKAASSALQDLLKELTYAGDTGLSLRTREANARSAFTPLANVIRSGGAVDQEEFADVARDYLSIARELYGSTQPYFNLLNEITGLTAKGIQNAGGSVTPISSQTSQAIASATGTTAGTTTQQYSATQVSGFTAANDNAAALAATIVQQIEAQTAALQIPNDRLAYFTRDDVRAVMTEAMQQAFAGLTGRSDGQGNITFTVTPVVDAVATQTGILAKKLDDVAAAIGAVQQVDSSRTTIVSAPTKTVLRGSLLSNG